MMGRTILWRWGDSLEILESTLERGGMLVVPTESSYGLAVDPRDGQGVDTVYRFKGRPAIKPLPVVVGDVEQLRMLGVDPEIAALAELAGLWPLALTVVVPIDKSVPASAGGRSLAVRVPAHAGLRSLLCDLGRPLTATSANPSGESAVCSSRIVEGMMTGWDAVLVDDGDLRGGAPSTIVRLEGDAYRVLRRGAVDPGWLAERLSRPLFSAGSAEIPADDRRRTLSQK